VLSADLGFSKGLGNKPLPFFKNYYAGGPGSVRGYKASSLGFQGIDGNALGGTGESWAIAECFSRCPAAEQDKSLRLATFLDAGQVFAASERLSPGAFRYSPESR